MQTCVTIIGFQVALMEGKLAHLYTIPLFPFEQLSSVQLTFKVGGGLACTVSVDLAA